MDIKSFEGIEKIFYSDEHLMKNSRALYERTKEAGLPYTRRQVEEWYKNQAIQQIFRPMGKITFAPIQKYEVGARVYADTMYMGQWGIVCIVDTFSKFAHARAFKGTPTAKKALQAFKEFEKKLGAPIKECRTDVGTEYMAEFRDYLSGERSVDGSTRPIKTTTLPYAKNEAGIVERLNGTIRRSLEKVFAVRGKPVDWPSQYLPIVLKSYNDTRHKTTGQKPIDIIEDKGDARSRALLKLRINLKKRLPKEELTVGDSVRKWIRDPKNAFDTKIAPNWSWDLYKVEQIDRSNNRVRLSDGSWVKPNFLQKVDAENLMKGPAVIQRAIKKAITDEVKAQKGQTSLTQYFPKANEPTAAQKKAAKELGDYLAAPEGKEWIAEGKRERKPKQIHDA